MPKSTDSKKTEPISDTELDRNLQLYRYWMNWVKRAKKNQPTDEWKEAEKRLAADSDDKLPYVNGYRLQYESLKSFLDQRDASFRITPSEAFMADETVIKQSECDAAYLKHIWQDQECQKIESRKLDSALQRNIGFTLVAFDKKKWMPHLKYIPARNVGLDPDHIENPEDAGAIAYWEPISLEELKAKNPDLTKENLDKITGDNAGSVLSEDEQGKINSENPEDKPLYTIVILYHIFARNDAAVRKLEGGEAEKPDNSIVTKLNLTTPRRYLQFVKGYNKPLKDLPYWPYDLDDNEWPITPLSFNTPSESLYGFTDHKQMKRLDTMCDAIFKDIERNTFFVGNKKFGGTPEAGGLKRADIERFLNDPTTTYHDNMIDSQGKSKVQQIDVGKFDESMVKAYITADDARTKASCLAELLTSEVEQYKDVTAIATRIHDANTHQRINRRLNGPEGYEKSIAEDAIKLLEIAHQFVPRYSVLEVEAPKRVMNDFGEEIETDETELQIKTLPWPQAMAAMKQGAKLVQLGIDAIVGEKLAPYWRTSDEYPARLFKLSTTVRVLPGSTRSITKEHKAALLKQYFLECYQPYLAQLGRWDLINKFLERIGQLAGIEGVKDMLPEDSSIQEFIEQQKRMAEEQQDIADQQQAAELIKIESQMDKDKPPLEIPEKEMKE